VGAAGAADLVVASEGRTTAVVVVAPDAGRWEKLAAADLTSLPRTTGALLARVPPDLVELDIGDNPQFDAEAVAKLPMLASVETLGLSGLDLRAIDLSRVLQHKQLRCLRLGGMPSQGKGGERTKSPPLTVAVAAEIQKQTTLEELDLKNRDVLEPEAMLRIASLPRLRLLDLTAPIRIPQNDRAAAIAALAGNRSLTHLQLIWCGTTEACLLALRELPLQYLDLSGAESRTPETVRELAAAWPGCDVRLPNGQRYRVR
jgi:hypothetical protein